MPQLEVRFYLERHQVMIRFPRKEMASAYVAKNSDASIRDKDHRRDVYLPLPEGLEYIKLQASQGDDALVFVFTKKDAAKRWNTRSVLGNRDGTAVQVKVKWEDRELNQKLGIGFNPAAHTKKPHPILPDDDYDVPDAANSSEPPLNRPPLW